MDPVVWAAVGRVGEIGKRDGLKHHCPQGLVGSSPTPGTRSAAGFEAGSLPQLLRYAGVTSLMASPIRWMRRALVEPGMPGGEPAMITTWSPSSTRPIS